MEIRDVRSCLAKLRFSGHAAKEMLLEEFGEITETEVKQTIENGEIIEIYLKDRPIPSCLVYGKTATERPLHVVCAPLIKESTLIVITVYQPDPDKWIDYKRRKK